ncbi:16S rRNA (cytosine(967)-C(5))-methyltransferase RsmB [Thauera sp.]|uniref:16S rRNA (cytosine(967)-C(5))-methyltransferase RsmB n=1 Tax=Thauera sp. TaxID=1905334 RepID=UPI0039B74128
MPSYVTVTSLPRPHQRSASAASSPRPHRSSGGPRAAPPTPPALASDSLAQSFVWAAELVAGVFDGGNLTEAYERMQGAHPEWPEATRGAVRDLAWSTLREFRRGGVVLDRLLNTPPATVIHALLLVALTRLRQRPEQSHTVVDQAVQAAAVLMPGLKNMVNGVLRNALRQRDQWADWEQHDPEARYGFPAWWIQRVKNAHPLAWEAALQAGNERPPMAVRVNVRRTSIEYAEAELAAAGCVTRRLENGALLLERALPVARLPGYAEGRVSVQDAGAQWAARLLDPQPGERVLDACAAPGGKAAHLLERADVRLLALELDSVRARRIEHNLARLGLQGEVKVADCRERGTWWDGRPFARILADVPCSASGVVRRHPDIKWLRRDTDIVQFAAQQAQILDALWHTLAAGGTMLYVTCSVFDEENAGQIARFCARHPDAQRLSIQGRPDFQLLPNAEHDGFYYALLRKQA